MATPAAVIKLARSYADKHYKEGANNDSVFGKWYGLNHAPWCAMFVSYCFNQVGAGSLVAAQTKKGFASCSAAVKWFTARKSLVNVAKAQPGDIVFMNFHGSKTAADHVGIVMTNDVKAKVLHCVEGNTVNPDGTGDQENGDGVYYKTRPYRYITYVARPNWAAVADAMVPADKPAPEAAVAK
jgi:cell wall-associated NlpC family hydrolase